MSTEKPVPKRAKGAPKSNGNAKKHGHYSRKVKLTRAGLTAISKQNGPGKELARRREVIESDLGGREQLSQLQADLVQKYLITELLIESLDRWLLEQRTLINRRRRAVFPILNERNRMIETSLKLASALGLE